MKNYQKFFAVILAVLMIVSVTGCSNLPKSFKEQWSYKTSDITLPIGVYIYYLSDSYGKAQSFAQKTDAYDSAAGTYNGDKSFLKIEITDDDGNKAIAEDWIKEQTDKNIKRFLAVESLYNKLGCTLDEASVNSQKDQISDNWEKGIVYAQYNYQTAPLKDIYEKFGVSENSYYLSTSYASLKNSSVFDALYKKGGTKEVKAEEIEKFFLENYLSYNYFSVELYTKATGDEAENVSFSDDEINNYTNSFKSYSEKINKGASFEDVVSDYMKKFNVETDPSKENTEIKDELSIAADVVEELKSLEEGKASYKIVGEGNSRTYYFFYKKPLSGIKDDYISTNNDTILNEMKSDEFLNYLDEIAKDLDIEISRYVNKCKVSMFENQD